MSSSRPRIAFVIQRYGSDITGGSEAHCRQVAERMTKYFDVEVLTTCATDHLSWKNVLPEGQSRLEGVTVRRFPTKRERSLLEFHKLYDNILLRQLSEKEEDEMLQLQGPYCPALIDFISKNRDRYDVFIFFTYLYWPVVEGLPLVKDKALFVPTAHDEASFYVHKLDALFRLTPRLIFNGEEERFLILRRFNLPESTGRIVGLGVEEPAPGEHDDAWQPILERIHGNQILTYVGRVENGKGCDELVEWFLRYAKEESRTDLLLLLLGKRTLPLPPHPQILSPGYVSEYVKYHAMQHTDVSITPSPFESLSMAALEAWMHRKPVLANGRCDVLVGHCLRSNGGLWYTSYPEFRETLKLLLSQEQLRRTLGHQGRQYVEKRYRWEIVEQAYCEEIADVIAANSPAKVV